MGGEREMAFYIQKQIKNTPVKRRRSGAASWWLYLCLFLGCLIACGFVSAARYHFRAVELGYKSEELKQQRTQLEKDQRKLQMEFSRRTAPKKIDKRAQKQGLALPSTRQTVAVRRGKPRATD